MRKTASGALFAGLATAMVFAGTGVASAAAAEGVPSGPNQVCGSVYSNANLEYNDAPPEDSGGKGDVEVTGTLYDSDDNLVWTDSTDSANDGSWCLQGTSSMASEVLDGGYVVLETDVPSTNNPWEDPNGNSHVDSSTFFTHMYYDPLPTNSAWHFNFVV